MNETSKTTLIPRSLFVFAVLYGGMTCIAGILGAKQVALGPLAVEAGIFPFLLLVVLSSSVAELHGRDVANRLVRFGFIPLITAIILIQIVLAFVKLMLMRTFSPQCQICSVELKRHFLIQILFHHL